MVVLGPFQGQSHATCNNMGQYMCLPSFSLAVAEVQRSEVVQSSSARISVSGAVHRQHLENIFSQENFFVVSGLITVLFLILLLVYLNHRKKLVILNTTEELLIAEARYRHLFEQSPISLWEEDLSEVRQYLDQLARQGVTDFHRYFTTHPNLLRLCAEKIRIVEVNARTLDLYETDSVDDLRRLSHFLPEESEWIVKEELVELLQHGKFEITVMNRTFGGRELTIELRAVVAEGYEHTWKKVYVSVVDITEQTKLKKEKEQYEKQLQQTQKLEAIGSLAGGIAHDFNNILSPIMGRAELMLIESKGNPVMREHCQTILEASKRARDLIKQILAFSREVDQEIKPVYLSNVLRDIIQLVRPTLPTTIALEIDIQDDLSPVMADVTQLHQVVMNLVTNAFHAMEEKGGTLAFVLREKILKYQDLSEYTLSPGRYLQLQISDTGHGMDEETLGKIFNPYFSTKARDKGTGLGLAVVHGILRSYGGDIHVQSTVDKGTMFTVYLPVVDICEQNEVQSPRQKQTPMGNGEHILLVDDETAIAEVTGDMLTRLGYKVTVRVSSVEALEAFRNLSSQIDLVITDLTMPQMTGLQLYSKIKKISPSVRVIICTGFSEQLDHRKSVAIGVDAYLNKPVLMEDLAYAVHSVLQ